KQLRLHDAKQVEAKAARIKEWVTNKLKELEQQNQLLREQNDRCNQQLELLRNHIAAQGTRNSTFLPTRASLSLEVTTDGSPRATSSLLAAHRRRSESLEGPQLPIVSSEPHYSTPVRHRRNLSIGTTNLANNVNVPSAANTMNRTMDERTAVTLLADDLAVRNTSIVSSEPHYSTPVRYRRNLSIGTTNLANNVNVPSAANTMNRTMDERTAVTLLADDLAVRNTSIVSSEPHYSTPVRHRRNLSIGTTNLANNVNVPSAANTMNRTMDERTAVTLLADDLAVKRTPAWQGPVNVIVQGNSRGGSSTGDSSASEQQPRPPTPPLHRFPSWEAKIYQQSVEEELSPPPCPRPMHESTSYQDISVPVYATVKGRASQIRSMPFTGDSSDDSSEGEESMGVTVHNTPHHQLVNNHVYVLTNSANGQCSSSDTSLSASSPSKSVKTSSSLSPAKRSSSGSPSKQSKTRDTSFESGMSDDYAIPPDAVSCDSTASPSLASLCRAPPAADSPRRHDALEKSGHLAKLGGKLKTWRKRWFVLKNGTLSYWKSQSEVNRKPQGQIGLGEACKISRNEGAATFEIFTGSRTYYLTADSNATMEDWIRVLQNVQRRNATKLLLSKEDNKPTIQGWLTKVKNGHAKKSWCNPTGQINMRDARVEDVEHVSDSDSEEKNDDARNHLTVAIYPQHQAGIDYHVVLAQNALQQCLEVCELQDELAAALARQTAPVTHSKHGVQNSNTNISFVQQLLLCATQSLFTCDTGASSVGDNKSGDAPLLSVDCKSNPPTYSFVQGWQLLALAVSLFVPRNNRLLWYLKLHLSRHADSKTECGKYAAYCARALERTIRNGGREDKPSRMELCDVISKWETALREKGSGKFENSRVVRLTYRNRLYFKMVAGRFPVTRELAAELGALMAQLDMGDYSPSNSQHNQPLARRDWIEFWRAGDRVVLCYCYFVCRDIEEKLRSKWIALKGRSTGDCEGVTVLELASMAVIGRYALTSIGLFGGLQVHYIKHLDLSMAWLAMSEEGVTVLELASMAVIGRYALTSIGLFGGLQVHYIKHLDLSMAWLAMSEEGVTVLELASMAMAELTHLIADYKNALLRPGAGAPGTPQMNSLTRNGSHRSVRKPTSTPSTLPHMHQLSQSHHTHHTTGHNTLNSHATTMTLGSDRNATLTLSSHTSTFNQLGEARVLSHGQPDILKSTPDHHRSDKKRTHAQDSGVA
ncbi:Plekhh1, partial [Operophtera brumata]